MNTFDWIGFGATALFLIGFVAICLCLEGKLSWPHREARSPPVLFRGSSRQAQHEAAWRAIQSGRPVVAIHVGDNVWEFENFVARIDQRT